MLKPAPRYGREVSLIPLSGVQFLDFDLKLEGGRGRGGASQPSWFAEAEVESGGEVRRRLLLLKPTEEGALEDRSTGKLFDFAEAWQISPAKALEPFLDRWTPAPYLRVIRDDGDAVYDEGPKNWARVYVARAPEADQETAPYRVVLAFDTDLEEEAPPAGAGYVQPRRIDVETPRTRFALAASDDALYNFISGLWVDEWLSKPVPPRPPESRRPRPEEPERRFEYLAQYVAFIRLLAGAVEFPRIRLIDTISREEDLSHALMPIDLVIDVGNSRTCGILIEAGHGDKTNLSHSTPLALRDLSRPEIVYDDAFESRIEFSRAFFGDEGASRLSGRVRAFQWPSLARIGPEAARLSIGGSGTEGATGLSSPKRYLWDKRPAESIWRSRRPEVGDAELTSGFLLKFLTESGELIGRAPARPGARPARPQAAAVRPKFSRSSLYMLLMAEILAQALAAINSPARRSRQQNADSPRFLRNIIMTVPPATPRAERRIMKEMVDDAVSLVWRAMGWDREIDGRLRSCHVLRPEVKINIDESTATQLVYLYTEIVEKYRDGPKAFFEILGRSREGGEPSLRVASIDIGGGTSDLAIVTYSLLKGAERTMEAALNFREGFRVAGDDVVSKVLAHHVLPAVEAALTEAGAAAAQEFLRLAVGADRAGMDQPERQFRRRLVVQLLEPAALALLGRMEALGSPMDEALLEQSIGASWRTNAAEAARIAQDFDARAAKAGAQGFSLAEVALRVPIEEINATIHMTLAPALNVFCEAVAKEECDVLLLSGRPSRLPIVLDIVASTLALDPHRIVPMHHYETGAWYPYRDARNRVADPKTTVAVGAMLCVLADAQIEDFTVRTDKLHLGSTVRFIGKMNLRAETIANRDLLFGDLADPRTQEIREARIQLEAQTATLGFRQLPLERWPASPLYVIEVQQSSEPRRPIDDPLQASVAPAAGVPGGAEGQRAEETTLWDELEVAREFEDARGAQPPGWRVSLRLQTMKDAFGYWLDTGVVADY